MPKPGFKPGRRRGRQCPIRGPLDGNVTRPDILTIPPGAPPSPPHRHPISYGPSSLRLISPHFPIDTPAVNLKAGVLKADIYDSTLNPAREEDLSSGVSANDGAGRDRTPGSEEAATTDRESFVDFFAILLLPATAADLPAETLSPGFLSISTRKTVCAPSRIMT